MNDARPDLSDAPTVAVIGAGRMAGAILDGMVAAGLPQDRAVVTAASEETRQAWQEKGFRAVSDNGEAVRGAGVVIVGVKPYAVAQVLDEVAGELGPQSVVVSVAAGVSIATLEEHAGPGVPVMRVMPNTPALVGEGVFVVTAGAACTGDQIDAVEGLLATCGVVERVPEKLQDACSALSGSGPAYVFYVVDALVEGAVLEGVPRPLALRLAEQTVTGSAALLAAGDTPPAILREQVTSPGGSTAEALRVLDAGAVRHHLGAAVSAAAAKAARLGG